MSKLPPVDVECGSSAIEFLTSSCILNVVAFLDGLPPAVEKLRQGWVTTLQSGAVVVCFQPFMLTLENANHVAR